MIHVPVLQKEVLQYLNPKPNENFIDATIGEGGHSAAILERIAPRGKTLGIDQDSEILKAAKFKIQKSKFKNNLVLVCDNFANLKEIVKKKKFGRVKGILFDLGLSSWHLEKSGRGFSFHPVRNFTKTKASFHACQSKISNGVQKKEPLDMRYSPRLTRLKAEEIINNWSESEIERILREYGEEKFAQQITKEIVKERRLGVIKTTFQMVRILKKATPGWYQRRKIHFATKTFQALRIAVNNELDNLKKALPQALNILSPGGRLLIISFHSLEDKIVKNFFRQALKQGKLEILTKKPIRPSEEEIKMNPRSRSAKLRAAIKTKQVV